MNFRVFEKSRELILSHLLFLALSFVGCNLIDTVFKKIFDYIESTRLFGFFLKKEGSLWLLLKITMQLIAVTTYVFLVKRMVNRLIFALDTDNQIFGQSLVGIIFAFVSFFSQDNLKKYLNSFNARLDKKFAWLK